jgi:hypothetical protein
MTPRDKEENSSTDRNGYDKWQQELQGMQQAKTFTCSMVETTCMGAGLSKNILQGFFYLVYKKS